VTKLGLQQLVADGIKDGANGMTAVKYPEVSFWAGAQAASQRESCGASFFLGGRDATHTLRDALADDWRACDDDDTQGIKAGDLLPKMVAKNIIIAAGLHKEVKDTYCRIGHVSLCLLALLCPPACFPPPLSTTCAQCVKLTLSRALPSPPPP
jgi:alanine-glyoxylate transaminase/serine-glyoxylate transaminase/serine-pyruvate transaminase